MVGDSLGLCEVLLGVFSWGSEESGVEGEVASDVFSVDEAGVVDVGDAEELSGMAELVVGSLGESSFGELDEVASVPSVVPDEPDVVGEVSEVSPVVEPTVVGVLLDTSSD